MTEQERNRITEEHIDRLANMTDEELDEYVKKIERYDIADEEALVTMAKGEAVAVSSIERWEEFNEPS